MQEHPILTRASVCLWYYFRVLDDSYGQSPGGPSGAQQHLLNPCAVTSDVEAAFGDWRPRAVVFDCDGLLMDTESLWIRTQRLVCERYGVVFDANLQRRLVGLPATHIGTLIAAHVGEDPATIVGQLLEVNGAMVAQSAEPMPGAQTFVAAVSSRVPVAVASNSARRILDQALLRGGFDGGFAVTVSAEEVANPKPMPDVYLAAAAALGFDPEDCLAFEDSEAGAAAARSAGLKVIGIPASTDQRLAADLVRASLDASDLLRWVKSWPSDGTWSRGRDAAAAGQ